MQTQIDLPRPSKNQQPADLGRAVALLVQWGRERRARLAAQQAEPTAEGSAGALCHVTHEHAEVSK